MIREVQISDAQAIADIYQYHVLTGTATFEIVPPTSVETALKIEKILAQKAVFLVTMVDGILAGYAYATPFRDRPAYMMTCENSIYLHPHYIGQGYGSKLLGALIDGVAEKGFRQIIAVIADNEPGSVALHKRFGFEYRGTMKAVGRKFGKWLDTIYLQKSIGGGDHTAPHTEP